MSARFLNAINIDFELWINNLSATVFNKLPRKVAHISWRHVYKVLNAIKGPVKVR